MKLLVLALMAFVMTSLVGVKSVDARDFGFKGEKFQKIFYFSYGGKGSADCSSSGNACALSTQSTLWAIPAGTVIEKVYVIIDTAITGTTAVNVGDTDSSNGFCPTASLTLATPGMYCASAAKFGSYLRELTQSASTPNVVAPLSRYYSAAGKYFIPTFTTSNTAGAMRIVVEGTGLNL